MGEAHLERLGNPFPNPDEFFDRAFASSLMDRAIELLQGTYQAQNKSEVFDVIKPSLLGSTSPGEFSCWADQLNTNETAIRVAVHRLRKRFRSRKIG